MNLKVNILKILNQCIWQRRRHIHEEWNEENRLSKEGKELYQKRKEHVERSFADSKQNHGYRYAMYKGVKKNQHYTWLFLCYPKYEKYSN